MNIYKNVGELIGRTPILELKNIKKKYNLKANIFAKLGYFSNLNLDKKSELDGKISEKDISLLKQF